MDPLSLPKRLAAAAANQLGEVLASPQAARVVSDVEDRWIQHRHESKVEDGRLRGVRVVVHRGWVAQGVARVHLRVSESPELPGSSAIPYWDVVTTNLSRHATLAFPGVKITVEVAGVTVEDTTDRHGFAAVSIDVGDLPAGWHEVTVTVPSYAKEDDDYVAVGRVLCPSATANIAIISDIDDTVLRTGLDEGLSAFRRTIFGEATTRRAVAGMSSLYRGISRGVADESGQQPGRPGVFYVSTGSWAFYEMLVPFLQLRGFPRGPLFLTDWGPSDRYIRRSGREHKDQAIRRISEGYPDTPLVLIGDSGQADPSTYTDFAMANPGRVRLIMIISAGPGSVKNTEIWRAKAVALRKKGVPLYVVDDALEGVQVCRELELCDELTVEEVETEMGAIF